jgi:hypothetical protein
MAQDFELHHAAIAELEQTWLAAESEADQARDLALRAEEAARELRQIADVEGEEVKLLLGQAERFASKRDRAEAEAVAAFDRLWSAKGGDANGADSKFA